jgi:hypothetical protein
MIARIYMQVAKVDVIIYRTARSLPVIDMRRAASKGCQMANVHKE